MAKKYHVVYGTYTDALTLFREKGGRLYPSQSSNGSHCIVSGNNIYRIHNPDSPYLGNLIELGKTFGIDRDTTLTMSGGKMCEHFLEKIIEIPENMGYYSPKFKHIAKSGKYWHYLYCREGHYKNAIEIDLTAAYWTSWMSQPTIFYDALRGWIHDDNAMTRIRDWGESLPKWFKLILIGKLASHQSQYYIWEKDSNRTILEPIIQQRISSGYAFNSCHLAIVNVYKFMRDCHEIMQDSTIRIHTDSITVSACSETDFSRLFELEKKLKSSIFDIKIKGGGTCHLFNVNEGYIGRKVFGCKKTIMKRMKRENIAFFNNKLTKEKFQDIIDLSLEIQGDIFA